MYKSFFSLPHKVLSFVCSLVILLSTFFSYSPPSSFCPSSLDLSFSLACYYSFICSQVRSSMVRYLMNLYSVDFKLMLSELLVKKLRTKYNNSLSDMRNSHFKRHLHLKFAFTNTRTQIHRDHTIKLTNTNDRIRCKLVRRIRNRLDGFRES